MKLALITVLYNSDGLLDDFFKSVKSQLYKDYILYLIDNNPGPDTKNKIKELSTLYNIPETDYIECPGNPGVCAANNIGIKKAMHSGCEAFILMNNDIFFSNTSIFSDLILLVKKNNLSIVAPKIFYSGTQKLWYAGGKLVKWKGGVIHEGFGKSDHLFKSKAGFCGYAPTTFIFISREVFAKTGLLNEEYFLYTEDLDFIYRAERLGYRVWYEPSITIEHKVSYTTGGSFSGTNIYYNTRNRIYFSRTYLRLPLRLAACSFIFISMFYHSLRQFKFSCVKFFFRGIADGIRMPIKSMA